MQFFQKNGVGIRAQGEVFVDALGLRGKNILVSHAHSDHARPSKQNNYFMTSETRELVGCRGENVSLVEFGKKFSLGEFEVSFHPSGHILGSAQVKISNSVDAVVTTDFKLQKSILFEPAEILPCDTLVIESTFGLPSFSFPARTQVYDDMIKWINGCIEKNHFVVLAGYATGKAQELTKIANDFLGEAVLVHKKVFEQNQVYEKFGLKLGKFLALDHNLRDANILILPPNLVSDDLLNAISMQVKKKVDCAIATGWNFHSRYKVFPLSDHADFLQLVRYIQESGAKQVFTYHGFDLELARFAQKNLGVSATPLRLASQKKLQEFAV